MKEFGVEAKRLEPGKCEEGWDEKGRKSAPQRIGSPRLGRL
jgi:hypothetical protein